MFEIITLYLCGYVASIIMIYKANCKFGHEDWYEEPIPLPVSLFISLFSWIIIALFFVIYMLNKYKKSFEWYKGPKRKEYDI
jgi:hypothetical protein